MEEAVGAMHAALEVYAASESAESNAPRVNWIAFVEAELQALGEAEESKGE